MPPYVLPRKGVKKILYVYLPLGGKTRIFPVGPAYLANYVKDRFPAIEQQILDLSLEERKDRSAVLRQTLECFAPDVIAFSWRHLRYFGGELYNDNLKEIEYGPKRGVYQVISFVIQGFARWREYVISVQENIRYIDLAWQLMPGAVFVVGGAGFTVFHQQLMRRFPNGVLGVIGEGELFFEKLVRGKVETEGRVFKETCADVRRDIKAVDYEYIKTIFPEFGRYSGGVIGVQTNRGCSQECIYCPDTARDRLALFSRDPNEVVKEIESLQKNFDTRDIWFTDRLVVTRENVKEFRSILEGVLEKGLNLRWSGYMRPDVFTPDLARLIVSSGLDGFIVPITSGSQRVVDAIRLGFKVEEVLRGCRFLKEAGYNKEVTVELTFGVVDEGWDDIRKTAGIYGNLKELFGDKMRLAFNFCVVLPGAPLEEQALAEKYFSPGYNAISFNPLIIRRFAYMKPRMRIAFERAYAFCDSAKRPAGLSREEAILEHLSRNKF